MGLSLALCIVAYLLLAFNIEFDDFHKDEKTANIFRIHTLSKDQNGVLSRDFISPMVLPTIAATQISGINKTSRYLIDKVTLSKNNNTFYETISYADSSFFQLFDFPLTAGSHDLFTDKNSIYLSEEMATKYFGNEVSVGKTLSLINTNGTKQELTVAGVLQKIPFNNTFKFSALVRIENYIQNNNINIDDWTDKHDVSAFVSVSKEQNVTAINTELKTFVNQRNNALKENAVESFTLVPFKSDFTESDIRKSMVNHKMRPETFIIFACMVFIILLIACFNFTNTSMSTIINRMKEVGVRKAIGAQKRQIAFQFGIESILSIFISLILGLAMAAFIVPAFSNMWNLPYGLSDLNGLNFFIALFLIVFLTAIIAGIYPALLGSNYKPILLLNGTLKIKGTTLFTRILVGMQFTLSVIVFIAGVIFIQNTKFQEKLNFGYEKDKIISLDLNGVREFDLFRNAIISNPKILTVGATKGNVGNNDYLSQVTIDDKKHDVQIMPVGKNYFETMGLKFSQGRSFSLESGMDQNESVIVNQAFLNYAKIANPIGKIVEINNSKKQVIGVTNNHIDNLFRSNVAEPFVFYPAETNEYKTMLVKTNHSNLKEVQTYLGFEWKKLFPNQPFESRYLEESILGESRKWNTNLLKTFLFITLLGCILSVSGIFALASLNIKKKTKEIGIRKILGASINNLMWLINKEFVVILSIAGVMGTIAGFFFTKTILSAIYAYATPVHLGIAIACALSIFLVGISTTSSIIFKASVANPVKSLKTE